jgi:hypothetical protein
MDFSKAKNHFENALRNVGRTDYVSGELLKGLIKLAESLEEMGKVVEQIDASTR